MGRKKIFRMLAAGIVLACLVIGCGSKNYNAMQEKHAATKTYRDGVWKVRYYSLVENYTDRIKDVMLFLAVDVEQEMSEQDMLDIMDYYEFTRNAKWDSKNHYVGERESDYACYAVFYRSGTDEEMRRIKYFNGQEVEIPEEEQSYFPKPQMRSGANETGEEGINGPLP